MKNLAIRLFLLAAVGAISVGPASSRERLAEILPQFFVEGIRLGQVGGHEAHFKDTGSALDAMAQVNSTIAVQFATYPLGSTSGAFTFRIDPETGAYAPTSESFGPIFAERPETLGKNKINFGFTVLYYDYDSIDGLDLDNDQLSFNLVHSDDNNDGTTLEFGHEGDLVLSDVSVDLKSSADVVFATFGVTDRLDLGIAVPYVTASLDATIHSAVLPLNTVSDVHEFAPGVTTQTTNKSGDASGLGDVVLRSKLNFRKGFAGALDVRLPTGDEKDLLGSGATRAKLQLIAGGKKFDVFYGGRYPHINIGFTYSNGGYTMSLIDPDPPMGATPEVTRLRVEPPDEINYAVGFDTAIGPRITFAADVLGRILLDAREISAIEKDFLYTNPLPPPSPEVAVETRTELVTNETDLSLVQGTLGFKWRLGDTFLLSTTVLFPLTRDRGLEDDVSGAVGLNYTF